MSWDWWTLTLTVTLTLVIVLPDDAVVTAKLIVQ